MWAAATAHSRKGQLALTGHRSALTKWTGCIAGALTRREFEEALATAGLVDIEIKETHRVHEKACSAIVRAASPPEAEALFSVCEAPAVHK